VVLKFRNHLAAAQVGLAKARNPKTVPHHVLALRAPCTRLPDARAQKEAGRIVLIATLGTEHVFKLVERCAYRVRSRCEAQLCNHRSPIISAEFAALARHLGPGPRM
jgi:hypothetical protein